MILIKLNQVSWMKRIDDDFTPALDIQDDNNQSVEVPAPVEGTQSRHKSKPPPFRSVSNASSSYWATINTNQ